MKDSVISISALALNSIILQDTINSWVAFIGSTAITITTILIQIYRLVRDRDKDKKNNKPADAENKDEEIDESNG